MNHYEQKIEAKRERMLARAEKLDRISERGRKTFDSIHSFIPFGQPILVGHHSEKRHRRDLDKANRAMQMSFDASKLAGELRARASNLGQSGISSDDPDATDKLEEKLAGLEKAQAQMVKVNKTIRSYAKDRAKYGDLNCLMALEGLGFTAGAASRLLVPQWGNGRGPIGFPPYALSNNNANIARVKDRIAHLKRAAEREHKEIDIGNTGIKLVQNVEENRLQIIFPGKPDAEVRAKLKGSGFRWSPTSGAWQRHLGNSAIYAANAILRELRGQETT